MESNNKISALIIKYRNAALSEQEQKELDDWLNLSEENRRLFERLADEKYLKKLYKIDVRAERKKIKQLYELNTGKPFPVTHTKKKVFITVVVLFIFSLPFWLFRSTVDKGPLPSVVKSEKLPETNTTYTGTDVALVLSNGSTILPDSMKHGDSIFYESIYIKKVDGRLKIAVAAEKNTRNNTIRDPDRLYASLYIPHNKKYHIELTDGSKIWLNESSVFHFPMLFNLNKRDVTLTGEGYFKIMPLMSGATKVPFVVNAKKMQVNVVGTSFNVKAYDSGRNVKATLIEGAIEIVHGNAVKKMTPGQQATLTDEGALSIDNKSDTEDDIAWANRKLVFQDRPLHVILQHISQRYNVQFTIECCQLNRYTVTLEHDMPLADALARLEGLEEFSFTDAGKKYVVKRVN